MDSVFFCGFARASFRFDSRIGVDAARSGLCATQATLSKLELEFCVCRSLVRIRFSVERFCQDMKTANGHTALRRVFCERRARQGYSSRQWLHVSFFQCFLQFFPYRSGQVESACGRIIGHSLQPHVTCFVFGPLYKDCIGTYTYHTCSPKP